MLKLASAGFDFRQTFPAPVNRGRLSFTRIRQHGAGSMSETECAAAMHREWGAQLMRYEARRVHLLACLEDQLDPGTGRPPLCADAWPSIKARVTTEMLFDAFAVRAILCEYANCFGRAAADAFDAFTIETCRSAAGTVQPLAAISST